MSEPKKNADDWIREHPRRSAFFGLLGSGALIFAQLWESADGGGVRIIGRIVAPTVFMMCLWIFIVPSAMPVIPTPSLTESEINEALENQNRTKNCFGCLLTFIGALIGFAWMIHGLVGLRR